MKNIIKTRTSFGAGLTALAFSTIVTSTAFAQTCATVPTCEELGYDKTQSDCSGLASLKCPFDQTKYFCADGNSDSGSGSCAVGDILYSDMTCSSDVDTTKTAIGIVFEPDRRLAIALETTTAKWSTTYFDVDTLSNITSSSAVTADWQGKSNTAAILAYCQANGKSCPAVEYVNSYTTDGTSAGEWYLPAGGELNAIYGNMSALNTALSKVGGTPLPTSYHRSSSEYSSTGAWVQNFNNGSVYGYYSKNANYYVRSVLAF